MICRCGNIYDDGKQSTLCPSCRSKLGRANKRKGSANELRFSKTLQELFDKFDLKYKARRTPRSGAIHEFEPADIMLSGLPSWSIFKKVHFENKNSEQWSIRDWFEKALEQEKESGLLREPVLIIRKPNSSDEYAVVSSDFLSRLLVMYDVLTKQIK